MHGYYANETPCAWSYLATECIINPTAIAFGVLTSAGIAHFEENNIWSLTCATVVLCQSDVQYRK